MDEPSAVLLCSGTGQLFGESFGARFGRRRDREFLTQSDRCRRFDDVDLDCATNGPRIQNLPINVVAPPTADVPTRSTWGQLFVLPP
jgi:hypothetical protein